MVYDQTLSVTLSESEHDLSDIEAVLQTDSTCSSMTNTYAWSMGPSPSSRKLGQVQEERSYEVEDEEEHYQEEDKGRYYHDEDEGRQEEEEEEENNGWLRSRGSRIRQSMSHNSNQSKMKSKHSRHSSSGSFLNKRSMTNESREQPAPSVVISTVPSQAHSIARSAARSVAPSIARSAARPAAPSVVISTVPSQAHSKAPSVARSVAPSQARSVAPSIARSAAPSVAISAVPSQAHSKAPSVAHSVAHSVAQAPSQTPSNRKIISRDSRVSLKSRSTTVLPSGSRDSYQESSRGGRSRATVSREAYVDHNGNFHNRTKSVCKSLKSIQEQSSQEADEQSSHPSRTSRNSYKSKQSHSSRHSYHSHHSHNSRTSRNIQNEEDYQSQYHQHQQLDKTSAFSFSNTSRRSERSNNEERRINPEETFEEEDLVEVAVDVSYNDDNDDDDDDEQYVQMPNNKSIIARSLAHMSSNQSSKQKKAAIGIVILILSLICVIVAMAISSSKKKAKMAAMATPSPTMLTPAPTLPVTTAPTSKQWEQMGMDINGPGLGATFVAGSELMSISMSGTGERLSIGYPGYDRGRVQMYQFVDKWVPFGDAIHNTDAGDRFSLNVFGSVVSMSPEGDFVAIGNKWNQMLGERRGSVSIYQLLNSEWTQVGNTIYGVGNDHSGISISLSSFAKYVAIGAPNHNARNVFESGQVRVYKLGNVHNQLDWILVGFPIDGEYKAEHFGTSVSLSSDGTRVAVGAPGSDKGVFNGGAAITYDFDETDQDWVQSGQFIAGENQNEGIHTSLALSPDGQRLAIGSSSNDSEGNIGGQVRIYQYHDLLWRQLGADITDSGSRYSLSLSQDGNTIAIGSPENEGIHRLEDSGCVRIFSFVDGNWIQVGPNIDGQMKGNLSGFAVSLSKDGNRVAVAAPGADGIGVSSGLVQVFDLYPGQAI